MGHVAVATIMELQNIVKFLKIMYTYIPHDDVISALLALCVGNSLITGEFPSQRPVARSFDVFFDLRLNKRLGK